MGTVKQFEDLDVWQRARKLANLIYDASDSGAFARDFALRNQMRRASVSIMSNVAEGFESRTLALFIEFLGRAKASAGELRAQLYVAFDREYITREEFEEACDLCRTCSKQIARLIQYLQSTPNTRRFNETQRGYDVQP